MGYDPTRPLIIQSDSRVLLESDHPQSDQAAKLLSSLAELIKTPGSLHTYRLTPLSLWNAAASGADADQILNSLEGLSKFGVPVQVRKQIRESISRYGQVKLIQDGKRLMLESGDLELLTKIAGYKSLCAYFIGGIEEGRLEVDPSYRGLIKQDLIRLGYPVQDLAGYHHGEKLPIRLRSGEGMEPETTFNLRDYQLAAVNAFCGNEDRGGGSGVLVLPCGAGKTVIGIAALARLQCAALILTTNVASVHQWKKELLAKTDLTEELVGEYTGDRKVVKPITIATYQILTHRGRKGDAFSHMSLFTERDWGLIIYDEVHLLPAPVFRATADIQATRRLGLTATLVREDGREDDVFSLVGPKLYEAGWKDLEEQGWVARVQCTEVRVPMPETYRVHYAQAGVRQQHRIAGENPDKLTVLRDLLKKHKEEQTLVIGQYLDQLKAISETFDIPMISGEMPHDERDLLYERFNRGEIRTLVVSKVANFAVDLPDARVAIQVSGSFGSRQEEAQRLGRILRPKRKDNHAFFYSLVSEGTKEQDFSVHRQLFLLEQGYRYEVTGTENGERRSMGVGSE